MCAADSYCCQTAWDDVCVAEVEQFCGESCDGGGGGGCLHDECTAGAALDPFCSDCAQTVCGFDAYCCDTAWDDTCVNEAFDYCGC